MAKTRSQTKHMQQEMNAFVERNKSLGYTKLRVDGVHGRLSQKLMHDIKHDLGYSRKNAKKSAWGDNFLHRMRHPKWVRREWKQTALAVKNGKKRRARRRRAVRRLKVTAFLKPGVGTFDGRPVAKCAIPILNWCRANGWRGVLVSGWRSPIYSEGLCLRMCGRPSCPGRCAGRSTNHSGSSPARFAMDVSFYDEFRNVVARCPIRPKVHNSLGARDPVHFSPSGS